MSLNVYYYEYLCPPSIFSHANRYGLFREDMCIHTVARYENKKHVMRHFEKKEASIATDQEVSITQNYSVYLRNK